VINSNLPPILHRFRDIAFDKSKIALYFATPLAFNPADGAFPYIISPLKTTCFGLQSSRWMFRNIFNHFCAVRFSES